MNIFHRVFLFILIFTLPFSVHSQTQIISTYAGNDTAGFVGFSVPATAAELNYPSDIARDTAGNLFIADYGNHVIRVINRLGIISNFAGTGVSGYAGDGFHAYTALLAGPVAVCTDTFGNVFIADAVDSVIRKVNKNDTIFTFAGGGTSSSDGAIAATSCKILQPEGVATDGLGNLYICDAGANKIRKVTPAGIITTIAGTGVATFSGDGGPATAACLNYPTKITVDNAGNILFADTYNNRIRKITPAGIISTVAGNGSLSYVTFGDGVAATASSLFYPQGIATDNLGNIYIGDCSHYRIRKVNSFGVISTYIGTGVPGISGDGALPTAAQIISPAGISISTTGKLYFADNIANAIRVLAPNHAPKFVKDTLQYWNLCQSSVINDADTLVTVSDSDRHQTETWSVLVSPAHGTITGAGASYASTGTFATYSGLTYINSTGYTGLDSFTIQVSDGITTAHTKVIIYIRPIPVRGSITGSSSLCVGGSIMLTHTPVSDTGSWYSNSYGTVTSGGAGIGFLSGISSGVDTVRYIVNNSCGSIIDTFIVTVQPLPNPGVILGSGNVCLSATVTTSVALTDPVTFGVWSTSNTNGYVTTAGVFSPLSLGVDTVYYTVYNSCGYQRAVKAISINPVPYISDIHGRSIACIGSIDTLMDSVAGGIWSVSNAVVGTINSFGRFTGLTSGTDTVTYTISTSACSTAVTKTLTVQPVNSAGIIRGTTYICAGLPDTLIDTTASTIGSWQISPGSAGTVSATGIFTGFTSGFDTVYYRVVNMCNTDSVYSVIHVTPAPSIVNVSNQSICNSTLFKVDPIFSMPGYVYFSWRRDTVPGITSTGVGLDSISEFLVNDSAVPKTIVYRDSLFAGGCAHIQYHSVTVNPTPMLTSPVVLPLACGSDSVYYVPHSATPGVTFSWFRYGIPSLFTADTSGTDTIREYLVNNTAQRDTIVYYDTLSYNGCINVAPVTLYLNPLPVVVRDTNLHAVCSGAPILYLNQSTTPGTKFTWSRPSFAGVANGQNADTGNIAETLLNTTTLPISIYYTDTLRAGGCMNVQKIIATLNPAPIAPAIDSTPAAGAFCINEQFQKFGTSTAVPAGQRYSWSAFNAQVTNVSANGQFCEVTFNSGGFATIYLNVQYNGFFCYGKDSTIKYVNNTSSADTVTADYYYGHFVCNRNDEDSYQWGADRASDFSPIIFTGEVYQNYFNDQPDFYNYYYWVITSRGGCTQKTYYNAPNTAAVPEVNSQSKKFVIYPNPPSDKLFIENSIDNGLVTVYDLLGQSVIESSVTGTTGSIDITKLPAGVYVAVLRQNGITFEKRQFIKH
jgi:Secretion system C-terminal sorting domain/Bacterial Ig domain/PKD-like domain/NHL repeat